MHIVDRIVCYSEGSIASNNGIVLSLNDQVSDAVLLFCLVVFHTGFCFVFNVVLILFRLYLNNNMRIYY